MALLSATHVRLNKLWRYIVTQYGAVEHDTLGRGLCGILSKYVAVAGLITKLYDLRVIGSKWHSFATKKMQTFRQLWQYKFDNLSLLHALNSPVFLVRGYMRLDPRYKLH